jgi:SAM-dependent methyltransferase
LTECETARERLAASFGEAVDDYERGRPTYPMDAVRWLVGHASRVVDVGAGTGKLTESLVKMAFEIVAVEPNYSMVKKLGGRVAGAEAVCGRADALPIRSGWAECVVVAQAFHWFDDEPALLEMARVLTARGRLGLAWNVRDESVGWVAELARLTGPDNSQETRSTLTSRPYFRDFESTTFRTVQVVDRDTLVANVRSRSHVAALNEVDRAEITQAVLRLCDDHPELAGKARFEFPYETQVFRARKA